MVHGSKAVSWMLRAVAFICLASREVLSENQGCGDIPVEPNFKADQMEGDWYPMDVILHRNDSKINGIPLNTQCPMVTFSFPSKNKKTLNMVWNSTEGDLEYKLSQKGKGIWQSTINQSGTLAWMGSYKHFNGSMKVMKLEDNYLVLHFCSKKMFPLSFVFLSRTGNIPPDVKQDILDKMDAMGYRRSREMHIAFCQDDAGGVCLNSMWLLTFLPSLGLWGAHYPWSSV